jgi:hypothetical protein
VHHYAYSGYDWLGVLLGQPIEQGSDVEFVHFLSTNAQIIPDGTTMKNPRGVPSGFDPSHSAIRGIMKAEIRKKSVNTLT